MTNEELIALAFVAIEESETGRDAGSGHVLSDVLEERGETWETYADRMTWMPGIDFLALYRDRLKVIAAVLLFEEWDAEMWPTVERCEWVYFQVAGRNGWFGPLHRGEFEGRDDITIGPSPSRDLRRLDDDEEEPGEQSSFDAMGY